MEIWRNFISEASNSIVNNPMLLESIRQQKTYMYLFEGKDKTPKRVCFEHVIKHSKNEDQLYNLWEQSFEYEYQQLLAEGAIDAIASAYETAKDGAIKLKDTISDAARAAMDKVNSFLLEKSVQLVNLAKGGIEAVVKGLSSLFGTISAFKEKHPIAYKIIYIIGVTVIIAAIMAAFGGDAQAGIDPSLASQGGLPAASPTGGISDQAYEALRGVINNNLPSADLSGGSAAELQHKALEIIDNAQKAKGNVNLLNLEGPVGEYVKQAFGDLNILHKMTMQGDEEAGRLLFKMVDVGEGLVSKVFDGTKYVATR